MSSSLFSKLKFLLVAGVGLYSDGYLNISIGLIVPMLGYIYFKDDDGSVPTVWSDAIKGCLSVGMVFGQVLFGIFGDALGRHTVYGKELIITIFGTLLVILLPWHGLSHSGIVAWVSVFRFVTGVGIGGDYPMTSALCTEHSTFGSRAKRVLTVFASYGLGAMTSGIVYIVLLAAFKISILRDTNHLEWVWRLLLGLGVVPAIATLYARLTMAETKPYEKYVATETSLTGTGGRGLGDQLKDFKAYFGEWRHAKVLFATCASWFLYDIAYYGVNLNQAVILSRIGYGDGTTPYETLWNTAVGNIIVLLAGYLPGFYIAIFLPDWMGRVRLQFIGSIVVAVLYAVWAGVTNHTSTAGLMVLFTLSQISLNASCNATTWLIPTEVFPTRVRGTAHGLSAASGKLGAVLTAFTFGTIADRIGLQGVLGLFSGIMALCALVTLLIPETRGTTLEDIENETLFGASVSSNSSILGKVPKVVTRETKTDLQDSKDIEAV